MNFLPIFKLLATVITITDTGSASVSVVATDFNTEQSCIEAVQGYFTVPRVTEINGHRVEIRINATCRPR